MHETLVKYNEVIASTKRVYDFFENDEWGKQCEPDLEVKIAKLINVELPNATKAVQYYLNRQLSTLEVLKGFDDNDKQEELKLNL